MLLGYNGATTRNCSDLETDLRLCEENGFDVVEVRHDMVRAWLDEGHTLEELGEKFRSMKLKPWTVNAVYLPQALTEEEDPEGWKACMDDFYFCCEICCATGAPGMVVVPPRMDDGSPYPYSPENEEICLNTLRKLCDYALPLGISLAFEPVGSPKCLVRTVKQTCDMIARSGRNNLGIALDPCNLYANNRWSDWEDFKMLPLDRIYVVHINDYLDVPVEQLAPPARCLPGTGIVDLAGYIGVLRDMGYTGVVSVEIRGTSPEPAPAVAEAAKTTRAVLSACGAL